MKEFGRMDFRDKVTSYEGLATVVQCVDYLPTPSSVSEGTTFQLTKSQGQYAATHLFRRSTKDGIACWVDLTSNLHVDQDLSPDSIADGYLYQDGTVVRLCLWWTTPSDPVDDQWEYDIVVRKQRDFPEHPHDGEMITFADTRDAYVDTASEDKGNRIVTVKIPYYPDDKAYHSGALTGETSGDSAYKYRVFHVFATGKVTYTDCNIDDTNNVVGVVGYLRLARYMNNGTIPLKNQVPPFSTIIVWKATELPDGATWLYDDIDCVDRATGVSMRIIHVTGDIPSAQADRLSVLVESDDKKMRAIRTHLGWWGSTNGAYNPDYPTIVDYKFKLTTSYKTASGAVKSTTRTLGQDSGWRLLQEAVSYRLHSWRGTSASDGYGLFGLPNPYNFNSYTGYWGRSYYTDPLEPKPDGSFTMDNFSVWYEGEHGTGTTGSYPKFRCVLGNVGPGMKHEMPVPASSAWYEHIGRGTNLHDHAELVYAGRYDPTLPPNMFSNPFIVDFMIR